MTELRPHPDTSLWPATDVLRQKKRSVWEHATPASGLQQSPTPSGRGVWVHTTNIASVFRLSTQTRLVMRSSGVSHTGAPLHRGHRHRSSQALISPQSVRREIVAGRPGVPHLHATSARTQRSMMYIIALSGPSGIGGNRIAMRLLFVGRACCRLVCLKPLYGSSV